MICLLRFLDAILYHIAKQLFVFFLLYILLEWDSSLFPSMMIGGTCHSIDRLPFVYLRERNVEIAREGFISSFVDEVFGNGL